MRVSSSIAVLLALCALAGGQSEKKKTVDVEILENQARLVEDLLVLDIRVRIAAAKPIRGFAICFDFLSDKGVTLSSLRTRVEEEAVQPRQELAYHEATPAPPRAVRYNIRILNDRDNVLRASAAGPFPIE